jgi:hypothetical protein
MFLSKIKDHSFVISECVDKVGPTEDAVKALLSYGLHVTDQFCFSESKSDKGSQIWDFRIARLQLLQFRDRLETYMGINMGRYYVLWKLNTFLPSWFANNNKIECGIRSGQPF